MPASDSVVLPQHPWLKLCLKVFLQLPSRVPELRNDFFRSSCRESADGIPDKAVARLLDGSSLCSPRSPIWVSLSSAPISWIRIGTTNVIERFPCPLLSSRLLHPLLDRLICLFSALHVTRLKRIRLVKTRKRTELSRPITGLKFLSARTDLNHQIFLKSGAGFVMGPFT